MIPTNCLSKADRHFKIHDYSNDASHQTPQSSSMLITDTRLGKAGKPKPRHIDFADEVYPHDFPRLSTSSSRASRTSYCFFFSNSVSNHSITPFVHLPILSKMTSKEPGAGHQFPAYPVSWLKRDVLLFANSVGCTADELHFLYEFHPKFAVFPTYTIILPFKHTSQEVVDFYAAQGGGGAIPDVPKFDARRVVDGERKIIFLKPLPTTSEGRSFEIRTKVIGVYDKGKPGSVLETQSELVDKESNEVYARVTGSAFYVGQGGWGGPKGPKTVNYNPPEGVAPTATCELQTTATSALLYRLNGDYNPLHATPEPGQKMGFGGAIMHGLFSWNSTAVGLLRTLGGSDPANIKEFQCRFASPVKPGDKLVTQMWRIPGTKDKDGFEEVRFVTSVDGGKLCLSNGRALIRVVGEKANL
jgi:peroxisomal enoyl-CoA hydratase 2